MTLTNSVLVRSGKRLWNSNFGPIVSSSRESISSINRTACGFPMEIPVNSYSVPSTSIFSGSSEVCSGSPISTVTAVTLPFSTFISRYLIPDNVSTEICGLSTIWWSYAYFPTQRIPLPHIAPREPSRLYISMRQSATSDGVIRTNSKMAVTDGNRQLLRIVYRFFKTVDIDIIIAKSLHFCKFHRFCCSFCLFDPIVKDLTPFCKDWLPFVPPQ